MDSIEYFQKGHRGNFHWPTFLMSTNIGGPNIQNLGMYFEFGFILHFDICEVQANLLERECLELRI